MSLKFTFLLKPQMASHKVAQKPQEHAYMAYIRVKTRKIYKTRYKKNTHLSPTVTEYCTIQIILSLTTKCVPELFQELHNVNRGG